MADQDLEMVMTQPCLLLRGMTLGIGLMAGYKSGLSPLLQKLSLVHIYILAC